MNWKEQRLAYVDRRARAYERELGELVRALADVQVSDPQRGFLRVKKGSFVPRNHPVVARRPDAFEALPARMVENRVRSFAHRLRSAWGVE